MAEIPLPPVLTRWRHAAPPGRAFLEQRLREEGLEPHWWSNGPGERYAPHRHGYHKVLFCQAGAITFTMNATGERLILGAGDRLDLPAGWEHEAMAGPNGVTCVEGWRGYVAGP
ncbi:MAG: cupin [Chloroflexi bacterium]|nr:cupin [Chloroflexota bacterium]